MLPPRRAITPVSWWRTPTPSAVDTMSPNLSMTPRPSVRCVPERPACRLPGGHLREQGGRRSAFAEAERCGGHEQLAHQREQPAQEGQHRADEEQGHHGRYVHFGERAEEE